MNIIKPGEIPKETIRFSCSYCGCIFEAEKGEYETGPQYDPGYSCRCPTCGHVCNAPVLTGDYGIIGRTVEKKRIGEKHSGDGADGAAVEK